MISVLSLDYRSVQFFRKEILQHFKQMSREDIYYRFGRHISAVRVEEIVSEQLDDHRNYWYLADDPDRLWWHDSAIIGVLQLALLPHGGEAEVGISLLPEYRKKGVAKRLIEKAKSEAPVLGIKSLLVHMVSGNISMRNLATNTGIPVEYIGSGESEGQFTIEEHTPTGPEIWAYYTGQWMNQVTTAAKPYIKKMLNTLPF